MGTSSSAAEVSAKLSSLGVEMSRAKPLALNKTGQHGKTIFLTELRAKGVQGTTKVSRRVKARYDVKGNDCVIKYTGPAQLLDRRTKPHFIVPKSLGGSRRKRQQAAALVSFFGASSGRGAIAIPGIGVRAFARHPGTKGLHFFPQAKRRGYRELPTVYAKAQISAPLRKVFS